MCKVSPGFQRLNQLFPLLYGACMAALLWQAFRVMGQGFSAVATPPEKPKPTIHPELLDAEGQITREELLTVRFSEESGSSRPEPHPES
jgi:hypothetical protein